jgi:hypothetical protein
MNRSTIRNLLCAAAAAAISAFGTAAQAIHYDVDFDPPPPTTFAGILQIDVPPGPGCFTPGLNSCVFDVLGLNFTDTLGNTWDITAPQIGAGSETFIGSPDVLLALTAFVNDLHLVSETSGCGDMGAPTLSFSIGGIDLPMTDVVFACGKTPIDAGRVTKITQVPEPATLALLGIAIGGLAFTRRRKRN